ncbi:hypothetical protein DYI37_18880 [Fulvimarina endophytica]|uniref:SPW repeat-containing protein n=1 Tax=Fulvimarina endophytica TaxID=2293836 RepID=A0A371WY12_9HYPH|nr:hypothetical protein [Fulvimarina endophytica]RFC61890.1 hypothetical protein DYI37_18880 [Fulvimarina endophytica]
MTDRDRLLGIAVLIAAFGFIWSIYAFFAPSTGVNGTAGPLLAAFGHVAIALSTLAVAATNGWFGRIILALFVLAALLTALAGVLLLQPAIWLAALIAGILVVVGQSIVTRP